jgi:hypothetical protein
VETQSTKRALQEELEALQPTQAKTEPVTEQERMAEQVAGLKALLAKDWEAEGRAHVDAINAVEKSCPECSMRQPIENSTCELCGAEPSAWPLSKEYRVRRDWQGNILAVDGSIIVPAGPKVGMMEQGLLETEWRRCAATTATVDELKYTASKTSTPGSKWRVKHAARILKLRGESVPSNFWYPDVTGDEGTPPAPDPVPAQGITDQMVQAAIRHNELQLAKLDEELAKVDQEIAESKSKRSDSTSNQL